MAVLLLLAAVALGLFLHPYLTYPLSLRLFRRRPVRSGARDSQLTLTLLFSAYNEERSLPAKIENLRAIKRRHPEIQILAYVDQSTDRTLELLEREADLLEVVAATQRTGKAVGMKRLVARARGDVCIFTDANVLLDPEGIAPLRGYFADPDVGGVAGSLHYLNEAEGATAKAGGLYWRLEEKVKVLESACGSIMGADGSIFATRRSLYPDVPEHLLDDMTVSMSVLLAGKRLVFASDVNAYEKNATLSAEEFQRKRRIACRAYNTHLYLWPEISRRLGWTDQYKYVSHKLMRWFGVVWLGVAISCFAGWLALAGLYGLLTVFALAAAIGYVAARFDLAPFSTILQITLAVYATFVGIIDSFRGLTYQTWAPAKSRS